MTKVYLCTKTNPDHALPLTHARNLAVDKTFLKLDVVSIFYVNDDKVIGKEFKDVFPATHLIFCF